jgi:hypothetical protein
VKGGLRALQPAHVGAWAVSLARARFTLARPSAAFAVPFLLRRAGEGGEGERDGERDCGGGGADGGLGWADGWTVVFVGPTAHSRRSALATASVRTHARSRPAARAR